jgi:hypothetical protein
MPPRSKGRRQLAALTMAVSAQRPGTGLIHLSRTGRRSAIGYISPIEMELKAA